MYINNFFFPWYLETVPIGTHEAIVSAVNYAFDSKHITIDWYIPSVDKTLKQYLTKSNSFLSGEQEMRRMICLNLGIKSFNFHDLVGKKFLITVSLKSNQFEIKIKNILFKEI